MANSENLVNFQPGSDPRRQNGRREGSKNRSTIARMLLEQSAKQDNALTGKKEDLSYEVAMTAKQIKQALQGNTLAYKAVMDSAYGAPKQEIEATQRITIVDDL